MGHALSPRKRCEGSREGVLALAGALKLRPTMLDGALKLRPTQVFRRSRVYRDGVARV